MKQFILLLFFALISLFATAQDFPYGSHTNAELEMKHYDKDTNAHAVVLREFGKTYITTNNNLTINYEYHTRIKIFDSKAFKHGSIIIHIKKMYDDTIQSIRDIKATTYYKDANGVERHIDLAEKDIYRDNNENNKNEKVTFTLPDLHEGCIIEYQYKIVSSNITNFYPWTFQSAIPKIYSEYEASIPGMFIYNISLRGPLKLSKKTTEIVKYCFNIIGLLADCTKTTYVMENIPAFIKEDYMLAPKNYMSALYFDLSQYTTPDGITKKLSKQWSDIDNELQKSENFGGQLKRKSLLKDKIPPAILSITDTLTKAKAVYTYLQKWFKWNNYTGVLSYNGIKTPLEKRTGNSADINLSLVTALNAAGINANAVILSTQDNGLISRLYPVIDGFDYVIAMVNIGNHNYFLDATDQLLPFGVLPLRCINDQGRVVSLNKPSYWIDLVQDYKNTQTDIFDLTLNTDGKLTGSITSYSTGYRAYKKRAAIKRFNTIDEYVENLDEDLPHVKILTSQIEGLDSLNLPLTEKYEVEITEKNLLNGNSIAFNPTLWNHTDHNPFTLTERTYPVNMYTTTDSKMFLTLHYPGNYKVINQPAPTGIVLPNKGGRFITSFQDNAGVLTYSQVQQLDKTLFSIQEYPYLKEFYSKIIQNQQATIVFKKNL